MRRLRTASTRRLAVIAAAVAALALTAAVAQAALVGGGPVPAPKALANAILDAFKAPEPDGLTARIEFTNDLLPSGSLPAGAASPLASGAGGRLWIQDSGDFRIELQSDAGDAQIVAAGDTISVYDAGSDTVYRATLPDGARDATTPRDHGDRKLTLATVRRALGRLAEAWTVSGAEPTSTAGRPAYTVRLAPKDDGGLLGAGELAWDAVRGAPLRAAVYARGRSDPVLELKATEVSYDAVPDSAVRVAPPAGAEVVELGPDDATRATRRHERGANAARGHAAVEGPAAVQRELDFDLAVPATLAGLPRRTVRLVSFDGEKGALAIYGEGMGAIAVLQRKAAARKPGEQRGRRGELRLPRIDIDGATGTELATALGTVVTFQRGVVVYVVAGSVSPVAAENAARGLT